MQIFGKQMKIACFLRYFALAAFTLLEVVEIGRAVLIDVLYQLVMIYGDCFYHVLPTDATPQPFPCSEGNARHWRFVCLVWMPRTVAISAGRHFSGSFGS